MEAARRYKRRVNTPVVSVWLALETEGFRYEKWGAEQRRKPGDWIVDNDGNIYSVDAEVFAQIGCGRSMYLREERDDPGAADK